MIPVYSHCNESMRILIKDGFNYAVLCMVVSVVAGASSHPSHPWGEGVTFTGVASGKREHI